MVNRLAVKIPLYYAIITFLFLITASYGQNTLTLKKGVVIDSLQVPGISNNFSIYLPRDLDINKNSPVILGFDSKGRAGSLTRLYREAAEEYGYIVAISNFKDNSTLKEKSNYIPLFIDHIFSLFPIQSGRAYVTGIDEDAKIMSLMPLFYKEKIFGVIAIGDSHYFNNRLKMGNNFSYFGILNYNNHRYRNFINNKRLLNRKAIEADVLVYEGESAYPYPKLLKKPLSTFTLQAMLKGRIPNDSIWVKNLYEKELKHVETELRKGKYLYALEEVKRIKSKYHLFFDTTHLREKEKEIKKNKGYKKQQRLKVKYANKENYFRQTYSFLIDEDIAEIKYENLGWWQYQISELDTLKAKEEKYATAMVSRVKGFLKNLVNNYKITLTDKKKDFEKELFLNVLSTVIDNKDYESYKRIISLSAQDQDYQTALFYLERLLENEFKDIDALYNIEGTLPLRITREYNNIIKKHLGTSKYFFSK